MQFNPDQHFIHPALTTFADECSATLARLLAYVGTLCLFVMIGVHSWDQLALDMTADPASRPGFTLADRSRPAFAVGSLDHPEKSESYGILRHPEGGRKDIFRWGPPGEKPVAELEIYRRGGEFDPAQSRTADLAMRMPGEDHGEFEAYGVIASKFGDIALLRRPGRFGPAKSCLGFITHFDDPPLRILGWSCQGTTLPARRAAISCMLDRLTLLASGNEPGLAELFARAELKRSGCGAVTAIPADWVTAAENPRLRGAL